MNPSSGVSHRAARQHQPLVRQSNHGPAPPSAHPHALQLPCEPTGRRTASWAKSSSRGVELQGPKLLRVNPRGRQVQTLTNGNDYRLYCLCISMHFINILANKRMWTCDFPASAFWCSWWPKLSTWNSKAEVARPTLRAYKLNIPTGFAWPSVFICLR